MESTPNQNTNVIVLKPRNTGRFIHTVYQEDLEELMLLSRYFTEAREKWETKREEIRAALASGARVEDGVHTAELLPLASTSYTVQRRDSFRLVVR